MEMLIVLKLIFTVCTMFICAALVVRNITFYRISCTAALVSLALSLLLERGPLIMLEWLSLGAVIIPMILFAIMKMGTKLVWIKTLSTFPGEPGTPPSRITLAGTYRFLWTL